jgi:low temperature requirement protein LtrA
MSGRDIHEAHRVSTPLELLFDLTFATAFAIVGQQLSHSLSAGSVAAAFLSFSISTVAICWAWMSYSWFASAYDTDDWTFRSATMVQMVGVIVLALGVPQLFRSVTEASPPDLSTMVTGYIIMRAAMIFLWLRAAADDPIRRHALIAQALLVLVAQVLWTLLIFLQLAPEAAFGTVLGLGCVEVFGPVLIYRRLGIPPWHAHHIAERYGLLVMIALGECVAGAVAMVNVYAHMAEWRFTPVLIATACVSLTFGCWWLYFTTPFGEFLQNRRERAFGWSYVHLLIFPSIVAMGAGLQVAAQFVAKQSELTATTALAVTATSLGIYVSCVFLVNYLSSLHWRRLYSLLWALGATVVAGALVLARRGVPFPLCLALLTAAPFVVIVGHELTGIPLLKRQRRVDSLNSG